MSSRTDVYKSLMDISQRHDALVNTKKQIRQAVADYIASEGCSCCQNIRRHKEAKKRLAVLLNVPAYPDGSGYDFGKFESA